MRLWEVNEQARELAAIVQRFAEAPDDDLPVEWAELDTELRAFLKRNGCDPGEALLPEDLSDLLADEKAIIAQHLENLLPALCSIRRQYKAAVEIAQAEKARVDKYRAAQARCDEGLKRAVFETMTALGLTSVKNGRFRAAVKQASRPTVALEEGASWIAPELAKPVTVSAEMLLEVVRNAASGKVAADLTDLGILRMLGVTSLEPDSAKVLEYMQQTGEVVPGVEIHRSKYLEMV